MSIKNFCCIIFLCFSSLLFSQEEGEWSRSLTDKTSSFSEIQEEFNSEWANKTYTKGHGFKQFKRWENSWKGRLLPNGEFPEFQPYFEEFINYKTTNSSSSSGNSNWLPLGPFDYEATGSWSPGKGRVNVIAVDPSDAETIYVGTPSGGIWKSTDGGVQWSPMGDFLSAIGISGIAIDPNNSDILYVTTGDSNGGNSYSIGIWKTIDGGITWSQSSQGFTGQGNKIIINPSNSAELLVASDEGLFKSENSGSTWFEILPGNFRDLAFKPEHPEYIYAVSSDACHISSDNGESFTSSLGLPENSGRLVIGITPANPEVVYMLSAKTDWTYGGFYKSVDSGQNFSLIDYNSNLFDQSQQAWYDMAITVSDTDENTVVTGVLNLWKTTNGGEYWSPVNSWDNPSSSAYTHADIHFLTYQNGTLFCGSDGGIYKSENDGATFTDLGRDLQIGQFYTIAGTENAPNAISGGLQDNGGFYYENGTWKCFYGADGMENAIHPNNPDELWGMIQFGTLYFSTDGGLTNHSVFRPETGNWVTPMQLDPVNNRIIAGYSQVYTYSLIQGWIQISDYDFGGNLDQLAVYDMDPQFIYASKDNTLFKSSDGGATFSETEVDTHISSIEIHPADPQKIWLALSGWNENSKVLYSENGGESWQNLTINLPNLPANVVKYSETENGLYLGMDIGVHYYSDEIGAWIPFLDNLPNVRITDLEINSSGGLVRAGTFGRGVWESHLFALQSAQNDISLIQISGEENFCGNEVNQEITIRNLGTNQVNELEIEITVDEELYDVIPWTGSISPGGNETVNLPISNLSNGAHEITVNLNQPNQELDDFYSNNSLSSEFNVTSNGQNIQFSLQTDCWGSETSWNLKNDQNEIIAISTGSLANLTSYSENFCLTDGCYELTILDSYGDGMSGANYNSCSSNGSYAVSDQHDELLVEMSSANFGNQIIETFCLADLTLGCSDSDACNYAPEAEADDGSCTYPSTWYVDLDGDGYGSNAIILNGCEAPEGYSPNALDCDDNNADVHPEASGTFENTDNNCDGELSGDEFIPCIGDFNSDRYVDALDLIILMSHFGCEDSCLYDLTNEGILSTSDLTLFLAVLGTPCP